MANRPVIVAENDPFPRLLQAFLDPEPMPERDAAIAEFVAHELPDYTGWLNRVRANSPGTYPAEVRLASSQEELQAKLRGATVVVTESLVIGPDELAIADRLKVVQKFGTVLRNIDTAACTARGVKVLTLRRRANIGCAEFAFALMLSLAKKLNRNAGLISIAQLEAAGYKAKNFDHRYVSNSNWARIPGMRMLNGATLGIIGLGEIGRELAVRAHAFGMRISYYQRSRLPEAEERKWNAEHRGLEQLLAESDWVCLLLPSNPETRNFLDGARLKQMKRGACLINVSRAELVEREALQGVLASGHLGGLGLDTFYEEPGRADDPLLRFDNAIITPRIAAQPRLNALGDLEELIAGLSRTLGDMT